MGGGSPIFLWRKVCSPQPRNFEIPDVGWVISKAQVLGFHWEETFLPRYQKTEFKGTNYSFHKLYCL